MLKETIKKYYGSQRDLNCAEAMVYAANEVYDMRLEKETLRAVAGFGGGLGIEDVCGAITGGVAVLGIIFVEDRAHEGNLIKELTADFINQVRAALGSSNCKILKENYRDDESKCSLIVETAAAILEDIINKQLTKDVGTIH
ncbi:C-GCAxxG-C-C family (seleno)protein [Alkaliphilus crotonatoxidans]